MKKFTLQLRIVAREFDQALFQFAGFFFQPQFRQAFDPMYPLVDVVTLQVVVDQVMCFEQLATQVTAESDWVVLSVSAQQGGSVQKGQALATVCPLGDYQLVIHAEEGDIGRFVPGAVMRVTFEELDMEPVEATVTSTGVLGATGDVSTYPVYLRFEAPEGVLLGMHATVEGME